MSREEIRVQNAHYWEVLIWYVAPCLVSISILRLMPDSVQYCHESCALTLTSLLDSFSPEAKMETSQQDRRGRASPSPSIASQSWRNKSGRDRSRQTRQHNPPNTLITKARRISPFIAHFILLLELLQEETSIVLSHLESCAPEFYSTQLRSHVAHSIDESLVALTTHLTFTTSVGLHHLFSRLLHAIIMISNAATARFSPPKSTQEAIVKAMASACALYFYNREALDRETLAQLQRIEKANSSKMDKDLSKEPFYNDLKKSPEILKPATHYPKPMPDIWKIHYYIVSERLHRTTHTYELHPPITQCNIATATLWRYSFVYCGQLPHMPVASAVRCLLDKAISQPSIYCPPNQPRQGNPNSSEPPIPMSAMAVPFTPSYIATTDVPMEYPNTTWSQDECPEPSVQTQPTIGVPLHTVTPMDHNHIAQKIQTLQLMVRLQNNLLQEILTALPQTVQLSNPFI